MLKACVFAQILEEEARSTPAPNSGDVVNLLVIYACLLE